MVDTAERWLAALCLAAAAIVVLSLSGPRHSASAQVFGPPMTVFGSVTDSAGDIPPDLPVEALVAGTVCGRGKTEHTGDGDGRVTVYFADVVSREQTPGCGADGVDVQIRIGDRIAPQTLRWRPGPVQLDITFGDATPRPIPTFTPTPRPGATGTAEPPARTPTPVPTAPRSSTPGISPATSPSASPSPSPSNTATATPTATLAGGLVTRSPITPPGSTDDSGFPIWAIVVIALGALTAVGGGIGVVLARARSRVEDEDLPPASP